MAVSCYDGTVFLVERTSASQYSHRQVYKHNTGVRLSSLRSILQYAKFILYSVMDAPFHRTAPFWPWDVAITVPSCWMSHADSHWHTNWTGFPTMCAVLLSFYCLPSLNVSLFDRFGASHFRPTVQLSHWAVMTRQLAYSTPLQMANGKERRHLNTTLVKYVTFIVGYE